MERVVALLCNPSAGGGRAARVLPEVVAVDRPFAVSADCDPIAQTPTTIRVIPRAARDLAPQ